MSGSDALFVSPPRPDPRTASELRSATRRQQPMVRGAAWLAAMDSLAAVGGMLAVFITVNIGKLPGTLDSFLSARVTIKNVLLLLFLATAWPLIFYLFKLYETRRVQEFRSEMSRVLVASALGTAAASVLPLTSRTGAIALGHLPYFWMAAVGFCLLVRVGRRVAIRARRRHPRRVLIVGTGPLAQRVHADIRRDDSQSYEVVGFVDQPRDRSRYHVSLEGQSVAKLDQLENILMRQVVDEVAIALPVASCYQHIQFAIDVCERTGVHVKYGADLFESRVAAIRYHATPDRTFVAMHVAPNGFGLVVKRAIDIVGAAAGLALFAPVMLLVVVAIKVTSPGPVFFAQDRCGLNKRPLRMYKFRTMSVDADKMQAALETLNEASGPVFKIRNDPRITRLGRILRKYSIDELPQLWNVLHGDMSLVGPRPLPLRDVHRIMLPSDMRRFSMRPGLTCLWQVQGRNNLSFERWVELDLHYIDNWSHMLDLRILVLTIPAVLSGDGAA